MGEAWEIDLEQLSVDDVIELEGAAAGQASMGRVRELLGRLVSNRTEEEIGQTSIAELKRQMDRIGQLIEEIGIPKESGEP